MGNEAGDVMTGENFDENPQSEEVLWNTELEIRDAASQRIKPNKNESSCEISPNKISNNNSQLYIGVMEDLQLAEKAFLNEITSEPPKMNMPKNASFYESSRT